jgi:hypothetical protein
MSIGGLLCAAGVDEVILVGPGQRLVEGLASNFYVIEHSGRWAHCVHRMVLDWLVQCASPEARISLVDTLVNLHRASCCAGHNAACACILCHWTSA